MTKSKEAIDDNLIAQMLALRWIVVEDEQESGTETRYITFASPEGQESLRVTASCYGVVIGPEEVNDSPFSLSDDLKPALDALWGYLDRYKRDVGGPKI